MQSRIPLTIDEWRAFCRHVADDARRVQIEPLSAEQYVALDPRRRAAYDRERRMAHDHLGPYPFAPIVECREQVREWLDLNDGVDGSRMPLAGLLSSPAGSGKTTMVQRLLAEFDNRRTKKRGEVTTDGHVRMPVMFLTLPPNAGLNVVCGRAFRWAQEPLGSRQNVDRDTMRLVDLCLRCEVEVLVLDDADNLSFHPKHLPFLKDLQNQLPVSLLLVGVDLHERGPTAERASRSARWVEQLGNRTLEFAIRRPDVTGPSGCREWAGLVRRVVRDLILPRSEIALSDQDSLSYLHARAGGHIEELVSVLRRAAIKLSGLESRLKREPPVLDVAFLHAIAPATEIKAREVIAWSRYQTAASARHRRAA